MSERARRGQLIAAAVLAAAATPAAIVLSLRQDDAFGALFAGAFLAYTVMGFLILWTRPGNAVGRILLLLGVTVPVGQVTASYSVLGLPGGAWAGWASSLTNAVVFGGLLIFLPLLFPTGRFLTPRWRRFGMFAFVELALLTVVFALAPGTLDCCPGVRNPIHVRGLEPLEQVAPMLFPLVAATAVVAFVSVVLRYRRSRGEERLQMKWFTFAVGWIVLAAVGGGLASAGLIPEGDLAPLIVFPTGAAAIAVGVGIAVLRYRLYDIDVVINKTLVYGALAGFITAVYIAVVVGIGTAIGAGDEPSLALSIAATAVVAVAFQPVRDRVQRVANRLVYGRRATPYEVMASFSARMGGALEVEEVLPRMAEAAARGVGGTRARVTLELGDGATRSVTWPHDAPPGPYDRVLPVIHRGERVGEISVAKAPGDPLRPAEEALLRDLSVQGGLALHNVGLTLELRSRLDEIAGKAAALRESQRRLLTAADEERRRLERTIEEGPERSLQRMAATLEQAEASLGPDPAGAGALLETLQEETRSTLEDLREFARGIFPPLLADRGLAAALEAQARKAPVAVEIEAAGVGRFSQEVEAGTYFCVVEALAEASRRGATRATVHLDSGDGTLTFSVADDATEAQPAGARWTPGRRRIADRVEALGGTVEVRPGDSAVALTGRIPLAQGQAP